MAALVCATPFGAAAQVSTDVQKPPTLTTLRYAEDWSYLADPARRTGHWTERFKYIPLNNDGSIYLTTGLEARTRFERYGNSYWGSAPSDGYGWHRLLPYADLHVDRVRFFAQPIISSISDADHPITPVDTTGADMLQAFVEGEVGGNGHPSVRVAAGRKLVSLGAGRFIDTRYGLNILQAFDGADATVTGENGQVTALLFEPVDIAPGDFDDRRSRQKAVWGVYATQWLETNKATGVDVYYLGFRDRAAVFDQGAGRQEIHTFGSRFFGDTGAWSWNIEGAVQYGDFAGGRVAAWGVGGEFIRRFRDMPLQPELAFAVDIASGDDEPDDSRLGTLNALFPRGTYFGAQSPVGPRNLIHLHPTLTIHPHTDVAISLKTGAYWRESTGDGVYTIAGILERSGRGTDARFIGKDVELAVAWQATTELNLSASVGAFAPGQFIRDSGPGRTIQTASAMATFRF